MARLQQTAFQRFAILCCVVFGMTLTSGCSTLSGLGIPVGSSGNKLLKRAREISETPGQALLLNKELAIAPMATYTVEIADSISVEPVSFDATIRLPGDQIVKPDGTISLGEFGSYQANGKTVEQMTLEIQEIVDSQIRSAMEADYAKKEARRLVEDSEQVAELEFESGDADESEEADLELATSEAERSAKRLREARRLFEQSVDEKLVQNRVSVRVTNWDSKKIYVLGDVNSPGSFPFIGNETVLDAIIEAGGLGTKANHHNIIVSRPSSCGECRTVMKVCYDQIVQLGDTSTNYQLMPGDRVFVPSLTFMDDLKQSFTFQDQKCPRCAGCDSGCNLPTGCQ